MERLRNVTGGMLALIALGVLAVAVGVAWAVSSNGPYYALPAWDQKLPVSTQFVVLTDWNSEAVLDRETGLVWEQAPVTESIGSNWFEARQRCLNSTKGGRKGWRMPSIAELTTLVDPSVTSQTPLPAGHPFAYSAAPGSINAWSATTNAQFPPNAWTLSFLGGFVRDDSAKTSFTFVRCVRGGMNADA